MTAPVTIDYTNWRGERRLRTIVPQERKNARLSRREPGAPENAMYPMRVQHRSSRAGCQPTRTQSRRPWE